MNNIKSYNPTSDCVLVDVWKDDPYRPSGEIWKEKGIIDDRSVIAYYLIPTDKAGDSDRYNWDESLYYIEDVQSGDVLIKSDVYRYWHPEK